MNVKKLMRDNTKLKKDVERLIVENMELINSVETLQEIVQWCGGADDFQEGGKARVGWEKVLLVLEDAYKKLKNIKKNKESWSIRPGE